MERIIEIDSLAKMAEFAKEFADTVRGPVTASGLSLGLVGCMGAGKTTFVRLLSESFGIVGQVSSPSYVLQYEYEGDEIAIDHWDVYRVAEMPDELWEPPAPGVLRLVEWSNKFEQYEALDGTLLFEMSSVEKSEAEYRRVTVVGVGQDFINF